MSYVVYVLASRTKNYIYVGLTSDLQTRLNRHNKGGEKTTGPYAPFDLIFSEKCIDRKTARKRERYWKSGTGKEQLKKLKKQIKK
ncbi:MAG: endonuclease [Flavobacteriales bacterium]|nr:endonuclease [Flavobacteriales bacterium]|tara:strand:- start:1118 stop:1372 length:255 start_codon:yes stop_codon:yes gene_type:complete